jgi:hypothetical protein
MVNDVVMDCNGCGGGWWMNVVDDCCLLFVVELKKRT